MSIDHGLYLLLFHHVVVNHNLLHLLAVALLIQLGHEVLYLYSLGHVHVLQQTWW